jgi:hypothetical protein
MSRSTSRVTLVALVMLAMTPDMPLPPGAAGRPHPPRCAWVQTPFGMTYLCR